MHAYQPQENRHCVPMKTTQRTEAEWRAARKDYLGASEMPILVGAASEAWGSPFSLQAQKLGLVTELERSEAAENQMRWGNIHEPTIIQELGRELNARVRHNRVTLRSKRWPWLGCTPDARVGVTEAYPLSTGASLTGRVGAAYAQVKNCAGFEKWEVSEDGMLEPRRVWVQVQAEMAVTWEKFTYVAGLLNGCQMRWARIPRNDEYIEDTLIPAGRRFMEFLESGEMMPPDFTEASSKTLLAMYPQSDGKDAPSIDLPASFTDQDDRYAELAVQKKALEEEMGQIKNDVRELMGTARQANVMGRGNFGPYWLWYDTAKTAPIIRKAGRTLKRQPGKENA